MQLYFAPSSGLYRQIWSLKGKNTDALGRRLKTFRSNRVHLDDGKSRSNIWLETLSWCCSDYTKHKEDRTQIREENMFIVLSTAKMLGSLWLVYAIDDATGSVPLGGKRAAQWQRSPRRQTPSHVVFSPDRVHGFSSDRGSFIVDSQKLEQRVRSPNNKETVLDLLRNNPGTSQRTAPEMLGFPV
ncbi:hypothetical protein TNCV_3451671 [Trichonephila clavipes]|nr:hypothetical protein TNCV_3451671 [Trichonephila clavipes]